MIKILYIASWGDLIGGGPISLFNLIKNLNRERFTPIVVCPSSGSLTHALGKINVRVEIIKIKSLKGLHLFSFISSTVTLLKLIKREKISLIHSNVGASRESFYSGVAAKIMKIPFIYHARVIESAGFIDRILAKLSTIIIVISEAVEKKYRWLKNGDKLIKIYNGVDLKDFNPETSGEKIRNEFGINPNTIVVGTVGNLIPWKGHVYFLEAAREIIGVRSQISEAREIKFLVVGEDISQNKKYREELIKLTENMGLAEKVIFTGFRRDISQVMAALDILVLPSVEEPFGRVIIEAMACGKPVVATKAGGAPEIVKDGETGFLVPMKNPHAIAEPVINLLNDKNKAKEMGIKGRKKVEDFFDIETNVKQTENLYSRLLGVAEK